MPKEKIDLKKVKSENIHFRPAVTPASGTLAAIKRLAEPNVLISILKSAKSFDEDEICR